MSSRRDRLWENGQDETVEVNQRALIDKVLARYSGEFTVFRELLQNADDARATTAEIRFETKQYLSRRAQGDQAEDISLGSSVGQRSLGEPNLPDLKRIHVNQWSLRNDGMPFRTEDWNRLKKIADGNPDEQTIGAFGVGFYSLFSITDEPFVKSGTKWMGFYWRNGGDQLFARRGDLPVAGTGDTPQWTTFEMPLREPAPLPGSPLDLSRFLATSLTFMAHLRRVTMFFDGICLAKVEKEVGMTRKIDIPRSLNLTSPAGMMRAVEMTSTPQYMKATILRWAYNTGVELQPVPSDKIVKPTRGKSFFSLLAPFASTTSLVGQTVSTPPLLGQTSDPMEAIDSVTQLSVFAADVSVHLDERMNNELERATKKRPPSRSRYQLIYTGKDEYEANKREDENHSKGLGSVFHGLRADLDGAGRTHVFIGHATAQTTGIGGHIAARFIPTVERESIDLVDRSVSVWNKELLYIGGLLARVVYELEITSIGKLWTDSMGSSLSSRTDSGEGDEILRMWLQGRCLHTLQFFTTHPTTPSPIVAKHFQDAFFLSGEAPGHDLPIISTIGVRSARDVRMHNAILAGLLETTPMLPAQVSTDNPLMLDALRKRGMCLDISFQDVMGEMESRILGEQEFMTLLQWRIGLNTELSSMNEQEMKEAFLRSVRISLDLVEGRGEAVSLTSIRTFINPRNSVIPLDSPLPEQTLPFVIRKQLSDANLQSLFGWTELSVLDWITHLVNPATRKETGLDITLDAEFSEGVLAVVARAWPSINTAQRSGICTQLSQVPCIPTQAGIKAPKEAYFPSVHGFPDLAVVLMPKGSAVKGTLEKVLIALGVRRHASLESIFSRVAETGDWTTVDLIKYLVSVRDTLTSRELDKLKQAAIFKREQDDIETQSKRYIAGDLYEPIDILRNLGLPTLFWGPSSKWKFGSGAKLMFELGLKRFPSLEIILTLAASSDFDKRNAALKYFMDNRDTRYATYEANTSMHLAFVPAIRPDGTACLASPTAVYSNAECAVMGFNIIDPSLNKETIDKLQVKSNPPFEELLSALSNFPPRDLDMARKFYEYLAGCVTARAEEFAPTELKRMSELAFIPVPRMDVTADNGITLSEQTLKPTQVYFGGSGEQNDIHSTLFSFVDFGPKAAIFLRAVGVKERPAGQEICAVIMQNPRSFKDAVGGYERYLAELKRIGLECDKLPASMLRKMAQSPMLIGTRRILKFSINNSEGAKTPDFIDDEDMFETQYELLPAEDILIIDDTHSNSLFGHEIWGAPQDDDIETFYEKLGSNRLSSLVSEEYRNTPSKQGTNKQRADDTRILVLERLPLFLHELTHMKSTVKLEWLARDNNFQVVIVAELELTRRLNYKRSFSSTQEVSAGARRVSANGSLTLWLAENSQTDFYEVAHSLCKALFVRHNINDSLIFMTILSTDLRALKRRGFNVDRILTPQNAEKERAQAARLQFEREKRNRKQEIARVAIMEPESNDSALIAGNGSRDHQSNPTPSTAHSSAKGKQRQSTLATFDRFRQKLGGASSSKTQNSTQQLQSASATPQGGVASSNPVPKGPEPSGQPTLQDTLEKNLRMAIAACRPEDRALIRNRRQMSLVKQSWNRSYCDIRGTNDDFIRMGEVVGYQVYTARPVSDTNALNQQRRDTITRFGKLVIAPLQSLYKLPTSSVHIFYGAKDELIGFNRGGGLFLNLKYYEVWHDELVKSGNLQKALVSWYFTLAHEIAHNLVQPHDAQHEYYFSVIAELHMSELCVLLSRSATGI